MKVWQLLFSKRKSSGIFVPDGKGGFEEYTEPMEGNGSYNSLAKHFGYESEMYTSIGFCCHDRSPISCIAVEKFTSNIIYVSTKKHVYHVDSGMIYTFMKENDLDYNFDAYDMEFDLSEGIKNKTLSHTFLGRVLDIPNIKQSGTFHSKKLGAFLSFYNGILINYEWDNPLHKNARDIKKSNKELFIAAAKNAAYYWKENYENIYRELNWQFEAVYSVPVDKKITSKMYFLHTEKYGAINFCMILVCHYNTSISQQKFEELNYGRYHLIVDKNFTHYRLGHFSYVFTSKGTLLEIYSYIQGVKALHWKNS